MHNRPDHSTEDLAGRIGDIAVRIDQELIVSDALRIDMLVYNEVINELKAQEIFLPVWEAQSLSYLKFYINRLGFLINFHVPLMKTGS